MKRKVLIISLILIVSVGGIVSWRFLSHNKVSNLEPKQEVIEKIESDEVIGKTAEVVENKEANEEKASDKDDTVIENKLPNEPIKQELKEKPKTDSKPKTNSSAVVRKPEVETTPKEVPEIKEEPKVEPKVEPKIDVELEKLKKGLFKTEAECLQKGIDISLTDTVNISGSYCESVAYKGQIIGYKLYIRYSSGEYKIFMNE